MGMGNAITPYEIAKLKQSGMDINDLKGGKNASEKDLVLVIPAVTVVMIPFIVGLYGYFRASESNKRNGYD